MVSDPVNSSVEINVLAHGQVGVQTELLRHVANSRFDRFRLSIRIKTQHARRPRGWRQDSQQHANDCRFSTAIGTQQAENRSSLNLKGHVVDSDKFSETARKSIGFNNSVHLCLPPSTGFNQTLAVMPARSFVAWKALIFIDGHANTVNLFRSVFDRLDIAGSEFGLLRDKSDCAQQITIGKTVNRHTQLLTNRQMQESLRNIGTDPEMFIGQDGQHRCVGTDQIAGLQIKRIHKTRRRAISRAALFSDAG